MSKRLPKKIYIDANLIFTDQPLKNQINSTVDYHETIPDLQVLSYLVHAVYGYDGKDEVIVVLYNCPYTAMYDRFRDWWKLVGNPTTTSCIAYYPDRKDLHKKDVIFVGDDLNNPIYQCGAILGQKIPILRNYVDIMLKEIAKVVNMR